MPSPHIAPVHLKMVILRLYISIVCYFSLVTNCHRLRLADFNLISHTVAAHARSDAAIAAFTLTSTTTARDPGVKIQLTGAICGLGYVFSALLTFNLLNICFVFVSLAFSRNCLYLTLL